MPVCDRRMENSEHSATAVKDPVCGMAVDSATARHTIEHAGKTQYFCGARCAERFRAEPAKYILPAARAAGVAQTHAIPIEPAPAKTDPRPAPAGALSAEHYICPMCAEVHSSKPGPCPKCGMALEREMPTAPARVEYTCPMHPEIVRPGPGACPICGMALEPRTVSAGVEDNRELRAMTRRFWVSILLTVPLLAIAMADMLPGMPVQSAVSYTHLV